MRAQCMTRPPCCAPLPPAWHASNESRLSLTARHGIAAFRPLVPGTRDEARKVHFRGPGWGKAGLTGKGREQDGTLQIASCWRGPHSLCGRADIDVGFGDCRGGRDGKRDGSAARAGAGTQEGTGESAASQEGRSGTSSEGWSASRRQPKCLGQALPEGAICTPRSRRKAH
jgi:hypothetical protein